MKLTEMIDSMVAGGASAETILRAVRVRAAKKEAKDAAKDAARRKKEADRKQRWRMSQNVPGTSRDIAGHRGTSRDTTQNVAADSSAAPQSDVIQTEKSSGQKNGYLFLSSSSSQRELFEESRGEVDARARARDTKFEEFWLAYPHKVGKRDALRHFKRIMKSQVVSFDVLMAGVGKYAKKTDDRPWCNPATWLNQGRWEDEPAANNGGGNGNFRNGGTAGHQRGESFALAALRYAREASEKRR